ncbi:MAG: VCBS repeat-containing protein [Candidatus Sulfotelmatobacter sp.]
MKTISFARAVLLLSCLIPVLLTYTYAQAAEEASTVVASMDWADQLPNVARLRFINSANPATNPYPQSVAVGDFNGDGKLDMIVPVYSVGSLLPDATVLLGNGNGTFREGPAFPVIGQNVNNAAVGDFNGDGILDLALSLPDANEVQVLLGNGDGSFTPLSPIPVSSGVFKVGTGDFNGDGKVDLVVSAFEVTVLMGHGDGTFTARPSIPITGGGFASAVGDFNGDGIADLAVVNNSGSESSPSSVTILLGKGDGTFRKLSSSPATGIDPLAIAVGDFDGDGILDLAVTNQNDGYPNPGTVTILIGRGNGTFKPATVSPKTGSIPYSVAVADFNGDGNADLVTANAGSNSISVLLGNGHGGFILAASPAAGQDPVYAAVADFNDDGIPDLAAADNTTQSVTVLLTERVPERQ